MTLDKEVMASNLRGYRARAHMSQQDVAELVGASTNSITNYENGAGGIGLDTAWALADLFDVSLGDLAGRDERSFGRR